MKQVQQDIMCALLEILMNKGLITQNIYESCRGKILDRSDWPDFFHPVEEKEN